MEHAKQMQDYRVERASAEFEATPPFSSSGFLGEANDLQTSQPYTSKEGICAH